MKPIYGYLNFKGQKDALEGDIRIKQKDSCWVWTKSPWNDDETKVIYNPCQEK